MVDFVSDFLVGGGRIREGARAASDVPPQGHAATPLPSAAARSPTRDGSSPPSGPRAAFAPRASACSTWRAGRCPLLPVGIDGAGALEPLQRGEQRSRVDLEDAAR